VGVVILGVACLVEAAYNGLWWLVAWGYDAVRVFVEGARFPI
jgi:hypothetical protein